MLELQHHDPHQHVHIELKKAADQGATHAKIHLHHDHIMLEADPPSPVPGNTLIRLSSNTKAPGSTWQLLELLAAHLAPQDVDTALVFHHNRHSKTEYPMRSMRDKVAMDFPGEYAYLTPAEGLSNITIVNPNGVSRQFPPYGCHVQPGINQALQNRPNEPVTNQKYALIHYPNYEIPLPPPADLTAPMHARLVTAVLRLAYQKDLDKTGLAWPDENALMLATIVSRYLDITPHREYIRPHLERLGPAPSTARRLDDPRCLRLTPEHAYVPTFPESHRDDLIQILKRQEPKRVAVDTNDLNVPRIFLAGITVTDLMGNQTLYPATSENNTQWPGSFPLMPQHATHQQREYTFRTRANGDKVAQEFTVPAPT